MKTNSQVKEDIREIVSRYGVELLGVTRNIQGSVDVELDINIYYKEHAKMETEIRNIKGVVINDIDYRDVA